MRQMCQAAKAIGNTEFEQKFTDGKCIVLELLITVILKKGTINFNNNG